MVAHSPTTDFDPRLQLDNAVCFVSGVRGSGKTTLAVKICLPFKRFIAFDPRMQVYEKLKELKEDFLVVTNIDDFVKAVANSPDDFRIVYIPVKIQPEFDEITAYIKETPFTDTMFLVDEVSMNCDTWNIPENFEHVLRFGRHNRIGLVMTAQRPVDVNRDLTAQCNHLFIFHQHEPNDIKYFSGFLGGAESKLSELENHSFLYSDFKNTAIVDKDFKIC